MSTASRWVSFVVVLAGCSGPTGPEQTLDGGLAQKTAAVSQAPAPGRASAALELAVTLASRSKETEKALLPREEGLRAITETNLSGFGSEAFRKPDAHDWSKLGAHLPSDATGTFRFSPARVERWALRATLTGAKSSTGVADHGRVVYPDAWQATDVVAMSGERHAELFFVLRDSTAPKSFDLGLTVGRELTLRKEPLPGGTIEWLDRKGDAALRIEPAFAIDANGKRAAVRMTATDGQLSLTVETQGLAYPVLVDPLISVPVWGYISGGPWTPRSSVALAYAPGGVVMFGGEFNYASGTYTAEAFRANSTLTGWDDIVDPVVTPVGDMPGVTWKGNFLYFGGCNGVQCSVESAVSASFNGSGWSPFCGGSVPSCNVSARSGHMMAAANSQLLIFGGGTKIDVSPYTKTNNNETYVLEATAPSNVFTAVTPSGPTKPASRSSGSMAGSDDHNLITLFGGSSGPGSFYDDTWFWKKTGTNAGKWECACNCQSGAFPTVYTFCPTNPPPRAGAGMAYDSLRKRFVLFGGFMAVDGVLGASSDDTWDFDPNTKTWSLLCGLSGSPCGIGLGNDSAAIAFDPVKKKIIQSAGYSGGYRNYSYTLYVRGGDCSTGADCDTGFCVNGSCCDTSTCGTCKTCGSATTPGTCTNITPSGTPDPVSGCAACDGAGTCKKALGVACAAGTECASAYCTDSVCCKFSTCGTAQCAATAPISGNAGLCKAKVGSTCTGNTDCVNGQCVDGVCCSSASCTGGACNYVGSLGTCKKNNGQSCTLGTDCGTGFCADGVCCNSACSGQCQACNVSPGVCLAVNGAPVGSRTACAGTGPCAARCDGITTTSCTYAAAGVSACGTPSCTAGVETPAGTCNGSGTCNQPTKSCGAYTCGATACKVTCGTTADCGGGYYCNTGTCSPKLGAGLTCAAADQCASGNCVDSVCCSTASCSGVARCNVVGSLGTCAKPNGAACGSSGECGSGFCIDGVCCDSACGGQCQACDTTGKIGTCTLVTGSPHGTRPACGGSGAGSTCGATCDGADAVGCHYPTGSKPCGAATCVSGVETHISVCNSAGSCSDVAKSCALYSCGATACKSNCLINSDCATGSYCNLTSGSPGSCLPIVGLGTTCSSSSTCASGFCTDGVCCAVASCGAGKSCSAGTTKGICKSLAGTACAIATDCATGACVDGVCCDSACNGPCEGCNQIGSVGKCIPIVGQPLPGHPACSGSLTDPTCGLRCNGVETKSCVNAATTAACGTPSCSGGVEKGVSTCDGGGTCKPSSKTCGSYDCGPTACLTSCTTNADCATGNFCKAGSCIGRQALGEKCADVSECSSGFCADGVCCSLAGCGEGSACAAAPSPVVGTCLKRNGVTCTKLDECASGRCTDGVCCDGVCDGQCEACNLAGSEGKCTPATGAPRGARTVCDTLAADDCAKRSCDGATRDKCNGFQNGATTSCGKDSCTADKRFQKHGNCDGKGGCQSPDPKPCTPFACDATTSSGCQSICATDKECADGFTCAAGTCIQGSKCSEDHLSSIDKTGASSSCLPDRCGTDGNCLKSCATSDDCAPGVACDTTVHACVATGQATAADGGCGCATPGTRVPNAAGLFALGASLAFLRARRRTARR